jgi:hypothetical protein
MRVNLVKRKRITHLGLSVTVDFVHHIISVCNRTWCCEDKTSMGESSEVTCKRCAKYVKEAEENDGVITLKPTRKRGTR